MNLLRLCGLSFASANAFCCQQTVPELYAYVIVVGTGTGSFYGDDATMLVVEQREMKVPSGGQPITAATKGVEGVGPRLFGLVYKTFDFTTRPLTTEVDFVTPSLSTMCVVALS